MLFRSTLFSSTAFAGGHKYSGPDLSGQKVVISGPWLAPEDGYMREIASIFEKATGAEVEYGGESGCGKTVTAMSIVDLLPKPSGQILDGSICLNGKELIGIESDQMHQIRGNDVGFIFQESMAALNPVQRIGKQITEALVLHKGMNKHEALEKAVELLEAVGIPSPERRVVEYSHQLSGGMRQRVMIAIALSCEPDLLIADEIGRASCRERV